MTREPPVVFISYSHDSPKHRERVRALAERLVNNGIEDCRLDLWEPNPQEGWPVWMDRQLDEANYILVVCTEGYYRKAKREVPRGTGHGVSFESVLTIQELYDAGMLNERFIPVLFEGLTPNLILRPLRPYTRYRVDRESGFQDLLRHILSKPRWVKPRVGSLPDLPEEPPAYQETSDYLCMAEPPPADYVERNEFEQIKEKLLDVAREVHKKTAALVALRGFGGFGKTTLAQRLGHDEEVQRAYPDGVLWIKMSESLTTKARLERVRDLMRRLAVEWHDQQPPEYDTLTDAGKHLQSNLLKNRRVLLVVDDVWSREDLRAFQYLAPGSALLITTRQRTIHRDFNRVGSPIEVDAMQEDEAIRLLLDSLPETPPKVAQLVRRLGYWPVLLKLVKGQLLDRVEEGIPISEALDEIEALLQEDGLEAFDETDEEARERAVGLTVEASLRRLQQKDRVRYYDLALFPEDADIPLFVLQRLWRLSEAKTRHLCLALLQRSLLLGFGSSRDTIRLHGVMRRYLYDRAQASLKASQKQLLTMLKGETGNWLRLAHEAPYFWQNLAFHFLEAHLEPELRSLLFNVKWLQAKLTATDVNTLLEDFNYVEDTKEARRLRWALQRSAHVLRQNRSELLTQLIGRLLNRASPRLRDLVLAALGSRSLPRLTPIKPCLDDSGALIRVLEGHEGDVTAIAVLPSNRVVSASWDMTLRIWDLETGETLRVFDLHEGGVLAVEALPDGRVASASYDNTIRIWEPDTGEIDRVIIEDAPVHALAFLPPSYLLSSTYSGLSSLRKLDEEEETWTIQERHGRIACLASLPPTHFVAAFRAGDLCVRSASSGISWETESVEGMIRDCVALSPDSFLTVAEDGTLRRWNSKTGHTSKTFKCRDSKCLALAVLPQEEQVVCALENGTLHLLGPDEDDIQVLTGHDAKVLAVAALPDSRIVSASSDNTLCLWNPDNLGSSVSSRQEKHDAPVTDIVPLSNGHFVTSSDDTYLRLWDPTTGECLRQKKRHERSVKALAVLHDDRIISTGDDRALWIWDSHLSESRIVTKLEKKHDWLRSLTVIKPNRLIASSSGPELYYIDLESGLVEEANFQGHPSRIHSALFRDGTLVAGCDDGKLYRWESALEEPLSRLEGYVLGGHDQPILALTMTPSGSIISASADGTIKRWEGENKQQQRVLEGHAGRVHGVSTPSDSYLVSIGEDKTMRLWSIDTGETLERWTLDSTPTSLVYLPKLHSLAVGDRQGHVHVFRLEE